MRIAALLATTSLTLMSGAAYAGSCTNPSNFTPRQAIETKFSDFPAGRAAIYSDGEERSRVFVLPHFVKSGGIWWRAISDIGGEVDAGLLGEATIDLYAENKTGDVCYGGEITNAFEINESTENLVEVSDDGSFVHGLGGEVAGTYMVANPFVGQTWTIESIEGGSLREEARVISVTSTRVTLQINHFEDGALTEVETKIFDSIGEFSASVPGEPTSTRVDVVQQ
jgi:hypothetical protein